MYTTNTAEAVLYQLAHSQADIAVVDGREQLAKVRMLGFLVSGPRQVLEVRHKLPELKAIVQWGEEEVDEEGVVPWSEFQALGRSTGEEELRLRLEEQAVNQPAVICYTSGTTANPKGVLLSQVGGR